MIEYKIYTLELRIDWSEMDLFAHVNNVAYFKYIQAARVNFWEQTGLQNYYTSHNIGPVVASTECKFLVPLFYPGQINIASSLIELKKTSFQLTHNIYNSDGALAAVGQDVLVMFNYHTKTKSEIPTELRGMLML